MKPRKKPSNIYISKKLNKNRFLEGKPSTSVTSTAPERIPLLFLVITFSAVFLYSQILQTVEKNSALAITVLRSYQLTDIPIVIFPYLILLICIIFFSFILPSWVGIAFSSVYAFFQSKKIKIKIMLIVGLFVGCSIYGSLAFLLFILLFGFIYGDGFLASINDLGPANFLRFSFLYITTPSIGILVGLPSVLGDMPLGESISKRLAEKGGALIHVS